MLTSHVSKYMIHVSEIQQYIQHFTYCDYYTFDTETCCTSEQIYNDYYIKKIKCEEKGDHAKVYAWGLSNTNNDYVIYGENLEQFLYALELIFKNRLDEEGKISNRRFKELKKLKKIEIAVHNLKFDIEFLKYTLIRNGYRYASSIVEDNKVKGRTVEDKCYNIIENEGIVYGSNIFLNKHSYYCVSKKEGKKDLSIIPQIEFFDTYKIMAQPLESIGKKVIKIDDMFNKKSDTYDYEKVREEGHQLTQLEKEYLYCDVYILKEFIKQFYMTIGTTSKTASGISFDQFLKITWEKNSRFMFEKVFPSIYDDSVVAHNVKKSYKGGWTFTDRHYLGKHLKDINGTSIDINSSYPSQMYFKPMPYGIPKLYKGFRACSSNKLSLLTIEFNGFYNKDANDYFGFLQANETNLREYGYSATDYVHTNIIDGEPQGYSIDATQRRFRKYIWNFELENILEHTILVDMIVLETLVFKAKIGIFNKAIEHFMNMKIEGKKTNNPVLTQFAKLCLNSFYGKMASSIIRHERIVVMKSDVVGFEDTDIEYETTLKYYPPFASAVTAWGRCTLRDALYTLCINEDGSFSPNVLYCDTDSIYSTLPVKEVTRRMGDKLHPTDLGKWDIEKEYNEFKAIGSKKYMLTQLGKDKPMVKCAGLPKDARDLVTYDTFYLGASFEGKLASKKVPGGILIIPIDFKLKVTNYNI